MEYRYYRDLKHSYVVCRCGEEAASKQDARYQLKIMESGKIPGLLASSLRTMNKESFLYYEVSSMICLEDRYSSNGMRYEELIKLLSDVRAMADGLAEYLLGEEGMVLDCRSIFVNLASGENKFMYYPFSGIKTSFGDFLTSLLDIIDHDDERAVELVYGLCDKAQMKDAVLIDIVDDALNNSKSEQTPSCEAVDEEAEDYLYEDCLEAEDTATREESGMERANRRFGGKLQLVFSLMFAAVIAGIMYIRINYILTEEENLLSIAVMLIAGITGAVAFFGGVKTMQAPKDTGRTEKKENSVCESYDDYEECMEYDELDKKAYSRPIRITASLNTAKNVKPEEYEETTVLDEADEKDMTLYSRNLDRTIRICLDKLPLTIGKMEGCVDRVISDESISRIHCRIFRDELGVALVDLGSTNGSYRNGLRLSPQEKTYIEEGDEVKLGRICFDLR